MIQPESVISPKSHVKKVEVIHNAGTWSAAKIVWDQEECLGIRWNGGEGELGNPQSRGVPTWFLLPKEVEASLLEAIDDLTQEVDEKLLAGYQEMANDTERENEALEWSESLIEDVARQLLLSEERRA